MKSLKESLFDSKTQMTESLFDTNLVKSKTVPEKLAYVLKKFFGSDVALCEDHQGSTKWYEVNPSTMKIDNAYKLKERILKYCEKVNGINIMSKKMPGIGYVNVKYIGDKNYWFMLDLQKYSNNRILIPVSKEFYDSMALPHDQKDVTKRGWEEWRRW